MPKILINGVPEGPLFHGRENRISAPDGVRLELFAPDGGRVLEGAGGWDIPLGPLMAPPRLRYRSGIAEWKGYGLKVTLPTGGGMWLSQAGSQERALEVSHAHAAARAEPPGGRGVGVGPV